MTPLRRTRAPLVLVALIALSGNAPPPDDLDAYVAEQMANRHIVGLSLAIVQDGRIVVARAYGRTDRDGGRTVDTTTLFQAGSISKPVAALGALQLVEQGRVSLDADVNTLLTSWKVPPSVHTATRPVTLRALLSHTAGLTVHGFPGYDVDSTRPTTVQVLDGVRPANTPAVRNDTSPGARWKYSGGGITIAQQLMVDVTKQPFATYMRGAVLTPLGMRSSSYEQPLPPSLAARTAAGHYQDGAPVRGRWHVYPEMAAAGLWTTESDLARFAIGVQRAYAGAPNAVVKQETARAYLTEVMGGYGLGVAVSGTGRSLRFSHGGRDEGFDATLMATANTGQAYAILINANDDSRMMARIGAFVQRKYGWPDAPAYTPPAMVPNARLTDAEGLYEAGNGQFLTFVARGDRLYTSNGGLDEAFVPIGEGRYASVDRNVQLTFAGDSLLFSGPALARTLRRLGPLLRDAAGGTLGTATAARVDTLLRAFELGRGAATSALTPGAKADFFGYRWPAVAGMRSATLVGVRPVPNGIVRHKSAVARIAYYRVARAAGESLIVVYLTSDDLVADVDGVDW